MTETLFAALAELVPEPDADGDWDGVLARAGAGRSRRRRLVVAAVAVAALALAAPALAYLLGLIGRTEVAFTTSPAAPAEIKERFADLGIGAPPGMAPAVIATEARKVVFRGGGGQERVLWIAPTRGGGFCFELTGGGGEGGCVRRPQPPVTVGGAIVGRRGQPPVVEAVNGKLFSAAIVTVTLEYADGSSTRLPFVYVSPPIGAGFFVYTSRPTTGSRGPGRQRSSRATRTAGSSAARRFASRRSGSGGRRCGPARRRRGRCRPRPRLRPRRSSAGPPTASPSSRARTGASSSVRRASTRHGAR